MYFVIGNMTIAYLSELRRQSQNRGQTPLLLSRRDNYRQLAPNASRRYPRRPGKRDYEKENEPVDSLAVLDKFAAAAFDGAVIAYIKAIAELFYHHQNLEHNFSVSNFSSCFFFVSIAFLFSA
jgi:hypothetical protein